MSSNFLFLASTSSIDSSIWFLIYCISSAFIYLKFSNSTVSNLSSIAFSRARNCFFNFLVNLYLSLFEIENFKLVVQFFYYFLLIVCNLEGQKDLILHLIDFNSHDVEFSVNCLLLDWVFSDLRLLKILDFIVHFIDFNGVFVQFDVLITWFVLAGWVRLTFSFRTA